MTQHHEHEQTTVPGGKPSQAEGDRETTDQAVGQGGGGGSQTQSPGGKPSQAEGDRETIEQDLGE
jgi:hypothetical protein